MPALTIKATTGLTKAKRVGPNLVVEKKVEGVITETHPTDVGKRVKGKQAAKELVVLTTTEYKAFQTAELKIKQQLEAINALANRHAASLETKHKAEMKKEQNKLNKVTLQLGIAKQASKSASSKLDTLTTENEKKADRRRKRKVKKEQKDRADMASVFGEEP
jgi:hypothetical protein